MKKKFVGVLLALCMIVGMLPVSAFAHENTVDTWDGTADTSWYDDTKTEFEISTAEQLAGLAELVNAGDEFAGKTVTLIADLDLAGHKWTSIGTGDNFSKHFGGVFDGQRHNIYNLTSYESATYHHGLFGVISNGGTVKNLGVCDANVVSSDSSLRTGILADWANNGKIINCFTTGTVKSVNGDKLLGGLVGTGTGNTQIIGCYSEAAVASEKSANGCDTVGGIVGQWENSTDGALIADCWFNGSISCGYEDAGVGGILGANFDFFGEPGVTINNCFVSTTDITCANPGNITWIAAVVDGPVTNCHWPVDPNLPEQYAAVVKLVVDWDAGTAGPDPNFDQSTCGEAITDWKDSDLINLLTTNAGLGINWVMGINHPTFSWDLRNIMADYTAVDSAIAKANALNKGQYKDFSDVEDAIAAVVRGKNITEQTTVDGYATAIENAITALEYKDADYGKVDAAIEKANALNKDQYKDFSDVEDAIAAVVRGKNITEQTTVDGYATAIENAITALEYKDADYGKVDEAIAKVNALNKDEYKDFSAVEAAIAAVVRGKNITEQDVVDGYATAIENAITALEYKDADYSKVDEAIAKANALNKDEYKDFSDVEDAIAAVVRGKNITEQTTVDGYATAIENAIKALEYKGADYSKVDEAIAKANALNKDEYKDFSAVEDAIAAVVRDKNITEQAEVDAMAKAINDAIASIEKEPTDKPTSLETGDNSNMMLWIVLLFVAGGGVIGTTVYGKKRKEHAE